MHSDQPSFSFPEHDPSADTVEIVCNIDDMTAEQLAAAMEHLQAAGALDVSCLPLLMKKGRPGHQLTCLAPPGEATRLAVEVLKHTSSNGVRLRPCSRMVLTTEVHTRQTSLGPVRIKTADGYGIHRFKPEAEDIKALAARHQLTVAEAETVILREIEA
jgi:uncharacterized protein (DUF111 family)